MSIRGIGAPQELSLEPHQVEELASRLLTTLSKIERANPKLVNIPDLNYFGARSQVLMEKREPSDNGRNLSEAYGKVVAVLGEILKGVAIPLPKTFLGFINQVQFFIRQEQESDACQDAARAIVLGEITDGFGKIVFHLRGKVQAEIMKALCYDIKEKEYIEKLINFYGFEELLPLLELSDQELMDLGAQDSCEDATVVNILEASRQADGFILSDRVMDELGRDDRVDFEDPQSVPENIFTVIFRARKEFSRTMVDERLISAQRVLITNRPLQDATPTARTRGKLKLIRP